MVEHVGGGGGGTAGYGHASMHSSGHSRGASTTYLVTCNALVLIVSVMSVAGAAAIQAGLRKRRRRRHQLGEDVDVDVDDQWPSHEEVSDDATGCGKGVAKDSERAGGDAFDDREGGNGKKSLVMARVGSNSSLLLRRAFASVTASVMTVSTARMYWVDLSLFCLVAWGVMVLGHDKLCGTVMRCGCTFPWLGGWANCNVHNTLGGPRCPWCTAPFWVSLISQKSCMVIMIVAYGLGLGGGWGDGAKATPWEAGTGAEGRASCGCGSGGVCCRAGAVCGACEIAGEVGDGEWEESETKSEKRAEAATELKDAADRELSALSWCVVRTEEEDVAAVVKRRAWEGAAAGATMPSTYAVTADGDDAVDEDERRALQRYPVLATLIGRGGGGKRRTRMLIPLLFWFALEMFWQVYFYVTLGAKQTPAYPCFIVCWGDVSGNGAAGSNPPSPLSMGYTFPPMPNFFSSDE